MDKLTIHIISHSHWDREWYLPLEKHKMRLLDLIDDNMEMFAKDNRYKSFHLDGQTIVLDDYLEIFPEKEEEIIKYCREGKFKVGPWYILQDEFLTSGESNIRNLLTGCQEAEKYGNLCKAGYFPDAFGNVGQMPQLLKQAGMEAVIFGRGVKPVGFNNEVGTGQYESAYSEMYWESPDGSALPGILFANWYCNGMEIPVDEAEAKAYWDSRIPAAKKFASTGELLFMNGCDHQPVQKDLPEAIETARKLYPDITFLHSDFPEYIRRIREETEGRLTYVKGELTSQETDGWTTLVNTCSSRIYLKQKNRRTETLLERVAEPLCAFAAAVGGGDYKYPHERLKYAWKILMQNHPHDSICGCSVDEVNEEMNIRFNRSMQIAESLVDGAVDSMISRMDTSAFTEEGALPFVVFNTTGWERTGTVTAVVDVEREYTGMLHQAYGRMAALDLPQYKLVNAEGKNIDLKIQDLGAVFGYDLPNDRFRQTYMARRLEVTFEAEVPAAGYQSYALVPMTDKEMKEVTSQKESLVTGDDRMENGMLSVSIAEDGTLTVTDKKTGRTYHDLCYFEDTMDAGNEYIYFCPEGNEPILTKGKKAEVKLVEDEPYRAVYEVKHTMMIPKSADESLEKEKKSMVDFRYRKSGRSKELKALVIRSFITLEKNGANIKIKTEFNNEMKDHRLRVVIPTDLCCDTHYADSMFEIVKRPNRHGECWKNPSGCEHQQYVTALCENKNGNIVGIAAANQGLYEYEVLPDEGNAIALTVLRSVGEMGDWGVFPTPFAQCLGECSVAYELIFFHGDFPESGAYEEASMFQVPWITRQLPVRKGSLPMENALFHWKGNGIYLTGWKYKEYGNDLILRFFNGTDEKKLLCWNRAAGYQSCYRSDVMERNHGELSETQENGYEYRMEVRPFEIVTIGMKKES